MIRLCLERRFQEELFRKAVFDLNEDETPGPDSFSMSFTRDVGILSNQI